MQKKSLFSLLILILLPACAILNKLPKVPPCDLIKCPEGYVCKNEKCCFNDGFQSAICVKRCTEIDQCDCWGISKETAELEYVTCPTPSPTPTPTPEPSVTPTPIPSITPTPTPLPDPAACPYNVDTLAWTGIAELSRRPCSGNCQKDGYLGYVINFSGTPHSVRPYCPNDQIKCEQDKRCQNESGLDIYMMLPGIFDWSICNPRSDNPYNCSHKPKKHETGHMLVCATPKGASHEDPRARCISVEVK